MPDRSGIVWFGRPPSDQDIREAKNRQLVIVPSSSASQPDFRHARAVVFWATPPHFEPTTEALEGRLLEAIDAGLLVWVVVDGDGQRREIERVLQALLPLHSPKDRYRLRTLPVECHEAPNAALMHSPGPAANDRLEILLPDGLVLSADQRYMLKRAFHDCKSIHLKQITSGLSDALTLLVEATLTASNAGPRPVPFFAKLDSPTQLRREMSNFQQFAEHHISWYLRPNFVAERRIYGVHQGILVGTFVDPSRSLWQVVLAGEGPMHIKFLFEETLSLLRLDRDAANIKYPGSVVAALEDFSRHLLIPEARVEAARTHGGVVHVPRLLWRKLIGLPS